MPIKKPEADALKAFIKQELKKVLVQRLWKYDTAPECLYKSAVPAQVDRHNVRATVYTWRTGGELSYSFLQTDIALGFHMDALLIIGLFIII